MSAGEIHLVYKAMLKKGMVVYAVAVFAFFGFAAESDSHLTAGWRNDGTWQCTIPKPLWTLRTARA